MVVADRDKGLGISSHSTELQFTWNIPASALAGFHDWICDYVTYIRSDKTLIFMANFRRYEYTGKRCLLTALSARSRDMVLARKMDVDYYERIWCEG